MRGIAVAKTITIDNVQIGRLQLSRNVDGELEIYSEYRLLSGSQEIQVKHEQVAVRLSGSRRAEALALLEKIGRDIETAELG
jgi:hypothetical protein